MQASVGQCRPIAAQPCQQRVLLVGGGCNSNLDLVVAGWGFVWFSNLVFYSRRGFPSFENNFQVILHSVLKPCVKHSCWVLLKAFAKSFFREWLTSFRIHCWHRIWKHSWNHFRNYVLNHVKTVSKSVRKHSEILFTTLSQTTREECKFEAFWYSCFLTGLALIKFQVEEYHTTCTTCTTLYWCSLSLCSTCQLLRGAWSPMMKGASQHVPLTVDQSVRQSCPGCEDAWLRHWCVPDAVRVVEASVGVWPLDGDHNGSRLWRD